MISAVSVTGTGISGSSSTSSAPTGTTVLTTRSAFARIAIHQMPSTKTAIGTVTVKVAAASDRWLSPVMTSTSTSIPAENAPAAANTR